MNFELDVLPNGHDLGPRMRALSKGHQLFVWHFMINGGRGEIAAIEAGYRKSNAANTARNLLARVDVRQAMNECTWSTLHNSAVHAVLALEEIVMDPLHKDRLKAAEMILSRTGFVAKTAHEVRVEHTGTQEAVDAKILALATELGLDPSKLLGNRMAALPAPIVIDAEIVSPISANDAEFDEDMAAVLAMTADLPDGTASDS